MSEICKIALIAAFIILFIGKTGLRYRLRDIFDKIGLTVVADMLDCDFCISFWTCLIVALCLCAGEYEFSILTIICSTPITRMLL